MLYHFTSCESLLKIILCDEIKFSKSMNIDDPFERKRSRNYSGWGIPNPKSKVEKNFFKYFNSLVNLTNILCFFDSRDNKNQVVNPLDDLKMWSHYGKSHNGCCLVVDKARTIQLFNDTVNDNVVEHGRVEYSADTRNYKHVFMTGFAQDGYYDYVFKELFHNLFFYKALYYTNENEYRFVINNKNGDFSLNVSSIIKKVVVAENPKEVDLISIVELCKLMKIEVGKMDISMDKLEYFKIAGP